MSAVPPSIRGGRGVHNAVHESAGNRPSPEEGDDDAGVGQESTTRRHRRARTPPRLPGSSARPMSGPSAGSLRSQDTVARSVAGCQLAADWKMGPAVGENRERSGLAIRCRLTTRPYVTTVKLLPVRSTGLYSVSRSTGSRPALRIKRSNSPRRRPCSVVAPASW